MYVQPGASFQVNIAISRGTGFTGDVSVTARELPSGITLSAPLTMVSGQTSGNLSFAVHANTIVGPRSLVIQGRGPGGSPMAETVLEVRVLSAGLDPAFGNQGFVEFTAGKSSDNAYVFERLADGKTVIAGRMETGTQTRLFVGRLLPDGTVDTSFGDHGFSLLGSTAAANAVVVQKDGKVLVSTPTSIFRLDAGGTPDPTFGEKGMVSLSFGTFPIRGGTSSLAVLADGHILHVTAGYAPKGAFFISEFDANGKLDSAFSSDGKAIIDTVEIETGIIAMRVVRGQGGELRRILLAGTKKGTDSSSADVVVAALTPEGNLEGAFGSGGVATIVNDGRDEMTMGLAVWGEKPVVAAMAAPNTWFFARLKADGSPDDTFDSDGRAETTVGGSIAKSYPTDVDVTPEGRVVAVGVNRPKGGFDPAWLGAVVGVEANGSIPEPMDAGVPSGYDLSQATFESVRVGADGSVFVSGSHHADINRDAALFKLKATDLTVDTAFAKGGVAAANVMPGSQAFFHNAVQPDGKIVAVGRIFSGWWHQILVARYLPNGTLDTTFDGDGWRAFSVAEAYVATARYVVPKADGKLLIIGDGFVAQLLSNGAFDPDFGEAGIFKPIGASKELYGAALQSDGAIVVAGLHRVSGFDHDVVVMRVTSAGKADGSAVLAQSGYSGVARRVALQADGKILLAATLKKDSNNEEEFALIRLGTDLKPDPSFDGDGWVRRTSLYSVDCRAVEVLADGKILSGGDLESNAFVARYDGVGVLDKSFGVNGLAPGQSPAGLGFATDLAFDKTGRIWSTGVSGGINAGLVRLTTAGALDTAFHGKGYLTTAMPGTIFLMDGTVAMSVQDDEKVVLSSAIDFKAGYSSAVLSRYLP